MSGLSRVKLGDLLTELEAGFACSKSKLVEDGLPHLRPFNIGMAGQLDLRQLYCVPESEAPTSKRSLRGGDVLFNNTNSVELVGKCALIESDMEVGFSNNLTRLRVDATKLDAGFLVAYFMQRLQKGDFARICTRWVGQAAVNGTALRDLVIPLPPIEEQRRIVDLLNRAASIRRLAEAAQAKARDLIPALFVSMFGDPATNPKGWPLSTIGALLREKPNYGTMLKPSTDVKPWHSLRVANIQRGELSLADKKFVDLPAADERRHAVADGDLLMARAIGSLDHLGKCVVAFPGDQRWAFDSHLMRIRVDPERIRPEFVKYCFETPGGRRIFLQRVRQSNVQFNINVGELSSLEIPVPPMSLQRSFVESAAVAISQLDLAERAGRTAEALTQSMMADVFAA